MESVIFQASPVQCSCVAELAKRLWPGHTKSELEEEFQSVLSLPTCAVFLLQLDQKAAGFAQCSLRHEYVEGTKHSPVGYLEGIYILEEYRRRGFGRALVQRCERWAKEAGCREFASDCEWENEESHLFHLHYGFSEANRIICFTKQI